MGAKWCYVSPDGMMVEYELAKTHNVIDKKTWILFKSRKEAKRWIGLLEEQKFGSIRNLRRQVDFPLFATRPDGLKEKICVLRVDFVYERMAGRAVGSGREGGLFSEPGWEEVIEDVKPRKGPNQLREDVYKLKQKWFESQYGKRILET
jgi:hypothetical protein